MAITIASAPENQTNWMEMFYRLQVELVFYLLVCCWSMGLNGAKYFFKVSSHFTTWILLNNFLDTLSIQDKIENENKEMKSRLDKLERENLNLKQNIANMERKSKGNNSWTRHLLTLFRGRGSGGVPMWPLPWCIGTWVGYQTWDLPLPLALVIIGDLFKLVHLRTSHWYWHLVVVTKTRTVGKWAVCILLESGFVVATDNE